MASKINIGVAITNPHCRSNLTVRLRVYNERSTLNGSVVNALGTTIVVYG